MMSRLADWLDHRTGFRRLRHAALYETIPGGARWRYIFGSALAFTFAVQVVTGMFLWMGYSPSARSAWESVFFIQYEVQGGWLLRGIHHYAAQAMVVLLALHVLQVVVDRAYKAPREVNFWLGLILLQLVLALALTGYLLPWDQKGYWATGVATNLMGLIPLIGPELQRLVVGGPTYGHATLTRFFALHAGILPAAMTAVLILHIALFRRHGVCAVGADKRPAQTFWPFQAARDAIGCLVVMAVILALVFKGGLAGGHAAAEPAGAYLGASLGAPADPAVPFPAARPEWYFLFLFQLLKYFQGAIEIVGAVIIPGLAIGALCLLPFAGRRRCGHAASLGLLFSIGGTIVALTVLALLEDRNDPLHQQAMARAAEDARRAVALARSPAGIPEKGAVSLLRNDPKTAGPELFARHCASCHSHDPAGGPDAAAAGAAAGREAAAAPEPSASNLYEFGRRSWFEGLFDPEQITGPEYFGNTSHRNGDMVKFVKTELTDREVWTLSQIESVIAAMAAEAEHEGGSQDAIAAGQALIRDTDRCAACHSFHEVKENSFGPDLTGYGSAAWMTAFISNPAAVRFYGGNNDRMPAFAAGAGDPAQNILAPSELALIVSWLRREWYEPERAP